jgi:transposase
MSKLTAERGVEPWRRRLLLPCYSTTEVAKYASTSPQTISNWHYRESKLGVALPGKERGKDLSYMQLVEVAIVA